LQGAKHLWDLDLGALGIIKAIEVCLPRATLLDGQHQRVDSHVMPATENQHSLQT